MEGEEGSQWPFMPQVWLGAQIHQGPQERPLTLEESEDKLQS